MAKLSKKRQDELILIEINNMLEQLKDISEDKKELAYRLIERVAFMTISLQILEDNIKTRGSVYVFEQGKQKMLIESPYQKTYNTLINRYTTAYDKLFNLLPKEIQKEIDDGFDDFVMNK